MQPELILYSTWGCHLCEQAEQLLQGAVATCSAPAYRVVDIVDDEPAFSRYRLMIPVLTAGDKELCWPFDADTLAKWLKELS